MVVLRKSLWVFSGLLILSLSVRAQNESDWSELDLIETEIEKSVSKEKNTPQEDSDNPSSSSGVRSGSEQVMRDKKDEVRSAEDLIYLENLEELAIIHPRYQPKFKRFQLFGGGGAVLNDPWYTQLSLMAKGTYHFTDIFGVELSWIGFSGTASTMAQQLEKNLQVQVASLVRPQSYMGAALYLSPIYGKMSLLNKRIVPYDVYFTLGYGSTNLSAALQNQVGTLHLGAGQIFALSRNLSFRWDIALHMFEQQSTLQTQKTQTQVVFMSAGMSYFLPEVKKR